MTSLPRAPDPAPLTRIAELDGLRAVAASVVLFFHLSPVRFAIGWTGVDLFFVLSGFLITRILLVEASSPRALLAFYVRRGLRIWPIYFLLLALVVLVNRWIPRPYSLAGWPNYATFTQNVSLYWGKQPAPFSLAYDHTWTLSLEEQYYLVWPFLVLLCGRRFTPILCLIVTALGYYGRAGFSLYFIWPFQFGPFFERLLLARSDGFALGGLLACLLQPACPHVRLARGLSAACALAGGGYLLHGIVWYGPTFVGLPTPSEPGLTILMVDVFYMGIVGLVCVASGNRLLAPLRNRWVCYLGMISYGIYLYHYPIFWAVDGFGRDGVMHYEQSWAVRVLKLGLTVVVAAASWRWFEQPILRLKARWPYSAAGSGARRVSEPAA